MRIGETLAGRYELRAALGGGRGALFKAHDARTDREVAVKVFDPARVAAADLQRYAGRLVAATAASHAAVVVPRVQVATSEAPPFVVGELLEGEDLAGLCERAGALPWTRALAIACDCADGLAALAAATGAAHGAVHPGNVWIDAHGRAQILDFGISELGPPLLRARADGSVAEFRAPEQLEGAAADGRSDVFSLGALLFRMLTGVDAFVGANAAMVSIQVLMHAAPRVTQRAPHLPAAVAAVVERALARKAKDRSFNSAAALGEALRALLPAEVRAAVAAVPVVAAGGGRADSVSAASAVPVSAASAVSVRAASVVSVSAVNAVPVSAASAVPVRAASAVPVSAASAVPVSAASAVPVMPAAHGGRLVWAPPVMSHEDVSAGASLADGEVAPEVTLRARAAEDSLEDGEVLPETTVREHRRVLDPPAESTLELDGPRTRAATGERAVPATRTWAATGERAVATRTRAATGERAVATRTRAATGERGERTLILPDDDGAAQRERTSILPDDRGAGERTLMLPDDAGAAQGERTLMLPDEPVSEAHGRVEATEMLQADELPTRPHMAQMHAGEDLLRLSGSLRARDVRGAVAEDPGVSLPGRSIVRRRIRGLLVANVILVVAVLGVTAWLLFGS